MTDAGAGKITLSKVSWYVPHVRPADGPKLQLYEMIEQKVKASVGFRMRQCESISVPQSTSFSWRLTVKSSPEKPRFIVVSFQTDKHGNQEEKNPSVFDHVHVKNMYVTLNSTRYPAVDYELSFTKQNLVELMEMRLLSDQKSMEWMSWSATQILLLVTIKDLFPIFVFDVSRQSEKLKNSVTDIQVKAYFNENVPANTEAFAVVISDRVVSFTSNGNKITVIS